MSRLAVLCLLAAAPAWADDDRPAAFVTGVEDCLTGADGTKAATDCIGQAADRCMAQAEGGYSTLGMSMCMHAETDAWDILLNGAYQQALATAKKMDANEAAHFRGFAVRAEKLRVAQRAWIAFRDAQCAFDYAVWGSGSMRNIAGASCFLQMTAERAIELNFLSEGME